MGSLTTLDVCATPNASAIWKNLAERSPDAWFWHTWANMEFNFVAAQGNQARNLSFFVLLDGKHVGLVPILVERTKIGDSFSGWDAAYYGGPLPWPAFLAELPDFEIIEDFAFRELERRAQDAGAGRIQVRLEPSHSLDSDQARLSHAISVHRYLDSSYLSHSFQLHPDSLAHVRERYRRYVKKFMPRYDLSIKEGEAVTSELEENYFHLHVKDAGGQFRSRDSYRFQADLARKHEAFYLTATSRNKGIVAGMLLVSVVKGAAYDNSVAVDPNFADDYISHLLKWTAIETLLKRGVTTYELGPKALPPNSLSIPSPKQYGISHFKDGWSNGEVRRVVAAEKYLDQAFFNAAMAMRTDAIRTYFWPSHQVKACGELPD